VDVRVYAKIAIVVGLGKALWSFVPPGSSETTPSIVGAGPKVGGWLLIRGHVGLHNWEHVTRMR
jgi:hypothetical protein